MLKTTCFFRVNRKKSEFQHFDIYLTCSFALLYENKSVPYISLIVAITRISAGAFPKFKFLVCRLFDVFYVANSMKVKSFRWCHDY